MSGYRLLVTGSRTWTDKSAIGRAFAWAVGEFPGVIVQGEHGPRALWDRVTVVHGGARGADMLAGRLARVWGMGVEPHPVTSRDWEAWCPGCTAGHRRERPDGSTYCPQAGNRRNQRMVDLGADLCIGFPSGPGWSGTRDCLNRAAEGGIRVVDWPAEGAALLAAVGIAS